MNSPIPAYATASLNVRGFHIYGRGQSLNMRDKRSNATALILKHDLTFFQETNFNFRENKFFGLSFPQNILHTIATFQKPQRGLQRSSPQQFAISITTGRLLSLTASEAMRSA